MAYELKEFPPLSWSFSRMKVLKSCPRRYFYQYYGYHRGWLEDSSKESRMIYMLKNLQGIDAYFGKVFHETVKEVVKNGEKELFVADVFRRKVNRTIKTAYQESLCSLDVFRTHPKWYTMMSEVYYGGDILQEKKDSITQKINITSENVFSSKSFLELTGKIDVEILELDELKSFEVNGLIGYLKIDALYRICNNNKHVLVDWKTSANDSDIQDVEQLLLYSWFSNKVLGIKLDDIEARLEYIGLNKVETYQFNEKEIGIIDKRLESDFELIKAYLLDPTINQPFPKEKFLQTKGNLCKFCNFREVC